MSLHLAPVGDAGSVAVLAALYAQTSPNLPWPTETVFFAAGVAFTLYWLGKLYMEVKGKRNSGATVTLPAKYDTSPQLWSKLQELLDKQREAALAHLDTLKVARELAVRDQQAIVEQLRVMGAQMAAHDAYVREHVGERAQQITRQIAADIMPHVALCVRTAFEDERHREAAARPTETGYREIGDDLGRPRRTNR